MIKFRIWPNLPIEIKTDLIPKYKDWPDIQAALRMPADPNIDIQDVFAYLLKADEYYKGTKWESHLFDVFPELEKYYIPKELTDADKKLFASWDKTAKKQDEITDQNII